MRLIKDFLTSIFKKKHKNAKDHFFKVVDLQVYQVFD